AEVNVLVIAANTTESAQCVNGSGQHCYLYDSAHPNGGSTTVLPTGDFKPNTATPDPYAAQVAAMFQSGGIGVPPQGVASFTLKQGGAGQTNGTRIFQLQNTGSTSAPTKVVVTVSGGKVTTIVGVFDPGVYTNVPGAAIAASDITNKTTNPGSGASFKL